MSRTQIGPFPLTMTALIEPADEATSRQMRPGLGRLKQAIEQDRPEPRSSHGSR